MGPDGAPWRWTCSLDGVRLPSVVAAQAHWQYSSGHLAEPLPPKLREAIWLVETERRAREALQLQARREQAERDKAKRDHPHAERVIIGHG